MLLFGSTEPAQVSPQVSAEFSTFRGTGILLQFSTGSNPELKEMVVDAWSMVCCFLPALGAGERNGEPAILKEVTLSSV